MQEQFYKFYKNLPVLVTGGAGFIGSHLAEKLVQHEAKVTILDNLSTGNLENLSKIKDNVKFIKGDINDFKICLNATKDKQIIFHLAAFVSVPNSTANPIECHNINVNGNLNLLETARINKVEKFIFSSSSAVYGNKNNICNENDICNPESIYGASKLIGEIYCKQYYQLYNMQTICLRYFNVYGPRQNPNGQYAAVFAKFSEQIKKNEPLTIFGDGTQTRDFIHVDDVVNANLYLAMLEKNKLDGKPVNIASGNSISLLDLVKKLKLENPNYNKEILFKPARAGDIKYSQASIKLLKELLQN